MWKSAFSAMAVLAMLAACDRKPAPDAAPAPTPTVIVPGQLPAGETPKLSYKRETGDASVQFNLPAAVQNTPALYAKLYADGRNELDAFAEGAKEELDELRASGETVHPYSLRVDYAVWVETPRLVGLVATRLEDAGGAHAITTLQGLIWDRKTGKTLMTRDLFRPGADLAAADKALCDAIHAAKQARTGSPNLTGTRTACPPLTGAEAALAPSNVAGKVGGLASLFAPYDIGAYSEGAYRVATPQTVLQPLLAPEYAAEFAGAPVIPRNPGADKAD